MQSLPRNGAMAAVFAGEDRVRATIAPFSKSVSIAATNSPLNTVISGNADDVRAVLERLAQEGMEAKPLAVSHAFHSPLVEPILDEFEQFARSVEHRAPVVDLLSNVTGRPWSEELPLDAGYWRRHARETVRFAESIRNLHARGIRTFLEIGPAPVLIEYGPAMCRRFRDDLASLAAQRSRRVASNALEPRSALRSRRETGLGRVRPTASTTSGRAADLPVPKGTTLASGCVWLIPPANGRRRPVIRCWACMCRWPAVPVSMFGLERSAWNDVPGWTTTASKGWQWCPPQLTSRWPSPPSVEAGSELPVVLTRIEIEKVLLLQPGIEFEIQTRLEQQVAGIMVFQIHSRRKNTKGDWTLHASGALRAGGIAVPMVKFDASQRDAFAKAVHTLSRWSGVLSAP